MKINKILIIPSLSNAYDIRMVQGLARGFRDIGISANAKNKKISSEQIVRECKEFGYTVVLKINEVRGVYEQDLKDIRVISWYQDIFCDTSQKLKCGLQNNDVLYTMGDKKILGVSESVQARHDVLMTAVNPEILNIKNRHDNYFHDFSICGFIPKNSEGSTIKTKVIKIIKLILLSLVNKGLIKINDQQILKKINSENNPDIDSILKMIVEKNYKSLSGSLDINEISNFIKNNIPDSVSIDGDKINYYAQTYPRKIDRIDLVSELLEFTNSIGLYGPNWDTYPNFKKYYKSVLNDEMSLINIYRGTKINLANNTHGIGIHSRTLEVMAIGGFIATHESINDNLNGGILDGFVPNKHFGFYRKGSIEQDCLKWLSNCNKRIEAGENAKEVIRNKHLWAHRAHKIIRDLNS